MSRPTKRSPRRAAREPEIFAILTDPHRFSVAGTTVLLLAMLIVGGHDVYARLQSGGDDPIRALIEQRRAESASPSQQTSPTQRGDAEITATSESGGNPDEGAGHQPAACEPTPCDDEALKAKIAELERTIANLRGELAKRQGRKCAQCDVTLVKPLDDGAVLDVKTPLGNLRRAIPQGGKETFAFCLE